MLMTSVGPLWLVLHSDLQKFPYFLSTKKKILNYLFCYDGRCVAAVRTIQVYPNLHSKRDIRSVDCPAICTFSAPIHAYITQPFTLKQFILFKKGTYLLTSGP